MSPEVVAAIALLRAEGYTVTPPPCRTCGGHGYVMDCQTGGKGATSWGVISNLPCSRGCRPPMQYNVTNVYVAAKPRPKDAARAVLCEISRGFKGDY